MSETLRRVVLIGFLVMSSACAAMQKSCSQAGASTFGSDWIVVQFDQSGHPFNCWKLRGAVVESSGGGNVDWKDTATGHLVHITGWENRVQVSNGDFASAARLLAVDDALCADGHYPAVVK